MMQLGFLFLSLLAVFLPPAEERMSTTTLANGLEIIVVPNKQVPLVTVVYVAKNGSYTESEEFAGLSHLYEHMFFKKNRVIPNEEAFNERNRELGMENNASTSTEVVEYHFTMPASNLEKGIEFMSHAIMSPSFAPEDVEREREVVLGEFDRNEASPYFALEVALDSALWGSNVVRKQPLGQRPVIKSATQAKMFAIQKKFYVPNNSALIVAGDVSVSDVKRLVEKYLGSWERGASPFPQYLPPAFTSLKPQLVVREAPEVPTLSISFNFYGPSIGKDNAGTYAADLFSTIINTPTSRFHKKLIDGGLALSVGVSYFTQQNTGPIQIAMEVTPEKAHEAIAALREEMSHWADRDYFSDAEIANAKKRIRIMRLYEEENSTQFAQSLSFWWAVTGLDYFHSYPDQLARVSRSDLQQFVQTYIAGKPYVVGATADRSVLDQVRLSEKEVLQ